MSNEACGRKKNYRVYNAPMAGRRTKKPSERRENVLRIRLTKSERAALEETARNETLDASTWARRVLLLEAKRLRS